MFSGMRSGCTTRGDAGNTLGRERLLASRTLSSDSGVAQDGGRIKVLPNAKFIPLQKISITV